MEIITPRELYIELFDKKGVNEQIMYVCMYVKLTSPPHQSFIDIF